MWTFKCKQKWIKIAFCSLNSRLLWYKSNKTFCQNGFKGLITEACSWLFSHNDMPPCILFCSLFIKGYIYFIMNISSYFFLPATFPSSDSPVKIRAQTLPGAVYWSLMRSQKRTVSPSENWNQISGGFSRNLDNTLALRQRQRFTSKRALRKPCHLLVHRSLTCFIWHSTCRFFWNSTHAVWSIHSLLHFFQVCFTWKWKFCLKASEPDKSSSNKKNNNTQSNHGAVSKMSTLLLSLESSSRISVSSRGEMNSSAGPQWEEKRSGEQMNRWCNQCMWLSKLYWMTTAPKWTCALQMQ